MKTFLKALLWIVVALGVLVAVLREFVQVPDATNRLDALPMSSATFSGRDVALTPLERGTFGRAYVLKRIYDVGTQRALVVVVDPSRDQRVIHDPLFVLRGEGWDSRSEDSLDIPAGFGRHVSLQRQEKSLDVVFWYSDTQVRHGSPPKRWMQSLLRRITFGRSGPEPVLVVLHPMEGEKVDWVTFFLGFPALFEL